MPLVMPPKSTALGKKSVIILTEPPAAPDGIPTLAEANAGVFASLHIHGDFAVTPTQNTGEGPRPLGSKFSPTELGLVNYPATDVQYSYKPQLVGTPGSAGNEVYEALVPGTQPTVIVLNDVDGDIDAITAENIGDVFLMECGVRRKGASGDGEFDVQTVTQSLVTVGGEPIAEDHAFAAA
jgi:hypothetical protein